MDSGDAAHEKKPPRAQRVEQTFAQAIGQIEEAARLRVWVAFSGGADSTALLIAAQRWCTRSGATNGSDADNDAARTICVNAVHINHGMHAQAQDWQAHCERVARDLEVPFVATRVQVAERGSREAAARDARYAAFASLLMPGDLLLLGHHRNDQVETVLMRTLRGSSTLGMRALRRLGAGTLLRPLLDLPRAMLAAYVRDAGIACIVDPSNADASLSRGYLRTRLQPQIEAHWPDHGARLLGLAERNAGRDQALAALLAPLLEAAVDRAGTLSVSTLAEQPQPVALALLAAWLLRNELPEPPLRQLRELLRQLRDGAADRQMCMALAGSAARAADVSVRRFRGRAVLLRNAAGDTAQSPPVIALQHWDGTAPLQTPVGLLRLVPAAGAMRWPKAGVIVATRRGGERMQLSANGPRRALKDLLREHAVAPWLRASWPLLFRNDGRPNTSSSELLCVPDVGIAAQCRAPADERSVRVVLD